MGWASSTVTIHCNLTLAWLTVCLPLLRVYIGCGEVLYGDIDEADLVKIHLQSGKLTLLKYEDYDASPLPKLKQRIKIRLRDQDIEFFDY